jgi:LmbE family N-acetylglucosaminyl deacetylase
MATLVFLHAHPDDEAIATGGTIRLASEAGHRVVVVFATRGECGVVPDGLLDDGETVAERREAEARQAASILGVQRVEFLGYHDSGMAGDPANDAPGAFWQADVDSAATRLVAVCDSEAVDLLCCYDDHGLYGHPDHVQVHRVGHRAALLLELDDVYESTMDRDWLSRLRLEAAEEARRRGIEPEPDDLIDAEFGVPSSLITTAVDVTSVLDVKRSAIAAHRSQVPDGSLFLSLAPELFQAVFGTEAYIRNVPGRSQPEPVPDGLGRETQLW